MMGRGRTHHHVSKKRSEDLSRKRTIVMDYYFLKPTSTANSQTIPDESVTCIAVKKDSHQNILSSVVLKKGIEEPWSSESGKIHQLVRVQRDHVEKRHRAGNSRVQKSCS